MIRLPPANFGDRSGLFNWQEPYEAWSRGIERVEIEEVPPSSRILALNAVALGEALAMASMHPEEIFYYTLKNREGAQFVWVGTAAHAGQGRGGGIDKEPALSVSMWVESRARIRNRQRGKTAREDTLPPPSASPTSVSPTTRPSGVPRLPVVPGTNTCERVAYLRGLAQHVKDFILEEGSTQRTLSQPVEFVIDRQVVCEKLDEVFYEFCEALYFK